MKDYTRRRVKLATPAGQLPLLILEPVNRRPPEQTPAILWIHGGGYATGMASMIYMSRALPLVKKYGAVVITPSYRLSGRWPYPAALEDCYEALRYLKEQAKTLGCNEEQLMVGGESAGGGLTVALCMYARDRGDIKIAYQMPLYPMIDDRDTPSSCRNYRLPWNTLFNHGAWRLYLRKHRKTPPVYAAPARQTDYAGLPPAYTFVGKKEPFYCETLRYVEQLQQAGVPARADVYATGVHAFDMLTPWRKISRQAARLFEEQFLYAKDHYYAKQNRSDQGSSDQP